MKSGKRAPLKVYRPREEWCIIDQPKMVEFLPDDIREAARAHIDNLHEKWADGYIAEPEDSASAPSTYILKGILRAAHDGGPMVGKSLGNPQKRYYARSRALSVAVKRETKRMYVPADPVERIVLRVFQQALIGCGGLRSRITDALRKELENQDDLTHQRARLEKARKKIKATIDFVTDNVADYGAADAKRRLRDARQQLDSVQQQLLGLDAAEVIAPENIDSMVDEMISGLHDLAAWLPQCPREVLVGLLEVFLAECTVDIDTRMLEVTVRVPRSFLLDPPRSTGADFAWKRYGRASEPDSIPLTTFRVFWLNDKGILYLGYGRPAA